MLNTILYLILLLKHGAILIFVVFIIYTVFATHLTKEKRLKAMATSSTLQSAPPDKAHGVIFGKEKGAVFFSPANNEGHTIVFGGSGSGKTSALLIPTLRSWTGTSLVIDISGDISSNCNIHNKLIFEPAPLIVFRLIYLMQ